MEDQRIQQIALSLFPGIGAINARKLVASLGGLEQVFSCSPKELDDISGLHKAWKHNLIKTRDEVLRKAEKELNFIEKNHIQTYFYLDSNYPKRLSECEDAPVVFFMKGQCNLDAPKVISIVGTRNASNYGRRICKELIEGLKNLGQEVIIVSGLAYGIDIAAHKEALKAGFKTIAVVGHGMNMIYPASHRNHARHIVKQGGILTDFTTQAKLDPGNFLRRNRIIAGLADATIVVESAEKGGALVTADIAQSYNRDVFAIPGQSGDQYSKGCNFLIKKNKAALIENAEDLIYFLQWDPKSSRQIQPSLFVEISEEEKYILSPLKECESMGLNELARLIKQPVNKVSSSMLALEFKGLVQCLPGNVYRLRNKNRI